ncbi:MAG TPA: methylenetetrahydrofolate reductase [Chthonomonadaceae bacterium]|nr:methylenetetrahydrofolate reductase [Chthonomonadaceae bacterium]
MDSEMISGSALERLLYAGRFVVCAEMCPPMGADKAAVLKKCDFFRSVVDAVNVTDNQAAIARMSSLMTCVFAREGGLEPILQLTCRDRNRLAQQSEVLSASAAGIRNLLCLTGDHQSCGNHPDAKGVFDLDSIQLLHMVAGMNAGRFLCGDEIKPPPRLFLGGAANPFAEPMEMRVMRLAKKIQAGARFIQTQPVFDISRFEKWMAAVRDEGLHEQAYILAGVMPVKSTRSLVYIKERVPGMRIPGEIFARMLAARDPREEGIEICVETIAQLGTLPGVKGVHIMTAMWESIIPRVVEEAGLLPRLDLPAPGQDISQTIGGASR